MIREEKTNILPNLFNARKIKGKFRKKVKYPKGIPNFALAIIEIPTMPPSIMLLGTKNISSANAATKAGEHVMELSKNKNIRGQFAYGWFKGVKVGIFIDFSGKVTTIFPDSDQTKPNNRRI